MTLFSPLTLRGTEIRNRIWLAPMCQYQAVDGVPGDWHLVHLGARAQGGFGLILTEAAAVVPEGRISPQDAGLWNDAQAEVWQRIVSFAHSQGARIGVQLAHAGRKASTYRAFPGEPSGSVPAEDGGWETLGPSAVAFPGLREPKELSAEDIAAIVTAFGDAAERAERAGFDTVEVHGAHGYLIHEFLSPLSNQREDQYGGPFENRVRLLLEVVEEIRRRWPDDKPVLVRISGTDWLEGGWDAEQSAALAPLLSERGVDLIDVSSGGNAPAEIPLHPGYQVPLAAAVRAAGVPTGAVGLIDRPAHAQRILTEGDADVVLLARAALRDPHWPLRAAHELGYDWSQAPWPPAYVRGRWEAAAR